MAWFDLADVEWVGVVVATLAAFIVGFVWYHPRALGTVWSRLADVDLAELRAGIATRAPFAVVALAVTAIVMNMLQAELLIVSIAGGLLFGAFIGVILRLLWGLFHGAYESRPVALTLLDSAQDVVALASMGAVIGAFL